MSCGITHVRYLSPDTTRDTDYDDMIWKYDNGYAGTTLQLYFYLRDAYAHDRVWRERYWDLLYRFPDIQVNVLDHERRSGLHLRISRRRCRDICRNPGLRI